MPRLANAEMKQRPPTVEFMFSEPLDLLNAMYFTSLVPTHDGSEGWPVALRGEMAPDLLTELDFLYNYPAGDPAIPGTLQDLLFAHPAVWKDVPTLVRFVRDLPDGQGESKNHTGVQGLVREATFRYIDEEDSAPYLDMAPRDAIESRIRSLGDRDTDAIMALYDRPAELRERLARLIERFFDEHYRRELSNRRPAIERSIAAHAGASADEALEAIRRLTGRPSICLDDDDYCSRPHDALIFCPSVDVGPYLSCADVDGPRSVHGMFYPCEPTVAGEAVLPDAGETQRLARIYKALGDEQRLRILQMLHGREMYAQEIVDRLDLHQSVVSRHLSFLKAVGLLQFRKQNSMKFYRLNPDITDELSKTLDLFTGAGSKGGIK